MHYEFQVGFELSRGWGGLVDGSNVAVRREYDMLFPLRIGFMEVQWQNYP